MLFHVGKMLLDTFQVPRISWFHKGLSNFRIIKKRNWASGLYLIKRKIQNNSYKGTGSFQRIQTLDDIMCLTRRFLCIFS